MFNLKPISKEAIARSLAKAERYRLLNEPQEAESICRDVLNTEPDHQEAIVALVLSLTDQFGADPGISIKHAHDALAGLRGDYERAYYGGIICERWAKAQLKSGALGHTALDWLHDAMGLYERAEELSPAGNEDAILRWNSCARMIERDPRLRSKPEDLASDAGFGDESPPPSARPKR